MFVRTSPSRGPGSPEVTGFHDPATGSVQYAVSDPATGKAAVVDAILDYDARHARTSTRSAAALLAHLHRQRLQLDWILDTHPHADHLTAAAWLQEQTGAPTAIGEKVREISALWAEFYHLPGSFDPDRDFDRLFADGDHFALGNLQGRVMLSPGHTLGSVTYILGDAAFVHDTLMHPDAGTTRADFPGGSSAALWRSLQAILALPADTRLFVGHDYPPVGGRTEPAWEATVAEQLDRNIHLSGGTTQSDYCAMRDARDATLPLPDRMLAALQVNLRAGRLPEAEADGHSYLKIPLNRFGTDVS